MNNIIITIAAIIFLLFVGYMLLVKEKAYRSPYKAGINLVYYLSWIIFAAPVFGIKIFSSITVTLIFTTGQFLLITALTQFLLRKKEAK